MKFKLIIFFLVITIFFCACTNQKNATRTEDIVEISTQEVLNTVAADEGTDPADDIATKKNTSPSPKELLENTSTPTKHPHEVIKTEKYSEPLFEGISTTEPSTAQRTEPIVTAPIAHEITMSINCSTAIQKGILHQPEFAYLPSDGYILPTTTIPIKEGQTVFEAFQQTMKKNKISYVAHQGYISSIHGLSAKNMGTYSGWLYRVNGKFPNVGVSQYQLHYGDVVEFIYTCEKGDVI